MGDSDQSQRDAEIQQSVEDEIKEMMSEMDSLEDDASVVKDEAQAPTAKASAEGQVDPEPSESSEESDAALLDEFRASLGEEEPSLETTLADLPEESSAGPSPLDDVAQEDPQEIIEAVDDALSDLPEEIQTMNTDGQLTLQVSGTLHLNLKYEASGQEVTVTFENDTLRICLVDGTEFKVPLKKTAKTDSTTPHLRRVA